MACVAKGGPAPSGPAVREACSSGACSVGAIYWSQPTMSAVPTSRVNGMIVHGRIAIPPVEQNGVLRQWPSGLVVGQAQHLDGS
jgi:hypothetical protein